MQYIRAIPIYYTRPIRLFTTTCLVCALVLLTACGAEPLPTTGAERDPSGQTNTPPEASSDTGSTLNISDLIEICANCHGTQGNLGKNNAPFLAGQHKDYLFSSLKGIQTGNRTHQAEFKHISLLSESQIKALSDYYSKQQANWSPTWPRNNSAHSNHYAYKRGLALSTPCKDCHGVDGNSKIDGVPSLAGLQPEYFIHAFENYFSDRRQDTIMKHFKYSVNWQQLHDLANYYAQQQRKPPPNKVSGNIKRAKQWISKCAGCHGISGSTLLPNMPDLAAQNPTYFINAVQAYKNGKRLNSTMRAAVANLSSEQISDIAHYYASLPPHDPSPSTTETSFDPIGEGKKLSVNCTGCHGHDGNAVLPGVPDISQLHPSYFKLSLLRYKSNARHHRIMTQFSKHLNHLQIEKLALYYATQKRPANKSTTPLSIDPELAAGCNTCHGTDGNSDKDTTPSLAAQNKLYLYNALMAYKKAERTHDDMQNAVKDLNEDKMKHLAAYYASANLQIHSEINLQSPETLATKCDRCHGTGGRSQISTVPIIAGQNFQFLKNSLLSYKNAERVSSAMYAMTEVLTLSEIEALARHYAKQSHIK